MEVDAKCVFVYGNFEVICTRRDVIRDKVKHEYRTQVSHECEPKWHIDLWDMKVDSWEAADDLIHQISCFINMIKAGEV